MWQRSWLLSIPLLTLKASPVAWLMVSLVAVIVSSPQRSDRNRRNAGARPGPHWRRGTQASELIGAASGQIAFDERVVRLVFGPSLTTVSALEQRRGHRTVDVDLGPERPAAARVE